MLRESAVTPEVQQTRVVEYATDWPSISEVHACEACAAAGRINEPGAAAPPASSEMVEGRVEETRGKCCALHRTRVWTE